MRPKERGNNKRLPRAAHARGNSLFVNFQDIMKVLADADYAAGWDVVVEGETAGT